MDGAEADGQVFASDGDDVVIGHGAFQGAKGVVVGGLAEGGDEHAAVGDEEVGVAGGN